VEPLIAPSILSADFARLGEEVDAVLEAGADWVHFDVMDNHYVPNLTIGIPVVQAIKGAATVPLDVHIMISNPVRYAADYVKAGADVLTCHLETEPEALDAIRAAGGKAGLAVNPETDIAPVRDWLDRLDMVLVMSVHPGFGGQKFMPEVLAKIETLRNWGFGGDIEIDGEPLAAAEAPRLTTFAFRDGDWRLTSHANFAFPASADR